MDLEPVRTDAIVIDTDRDDGWLDVAEMEEAVTGISNQVVLVAITHGQPDQVVDRMIGHARQGVVATRGEPGTDAVKRIENGRIADTLDRNHVVRARLPVACPRTIVEHTLAAAAHDRAHIHLSELVDLTDRVLFTNASGTPL